jgi:hypothetical protein
MMSMIANCLVTNNCGKHSQTDKKKVSFKPCKERNKDMAGRVRLAGDTFKSRDKSWPRPLHQKDAGAAKVLPTQRIEIGTPMSMLKPRS